MSQWFGEGIRVTGPASQIEATRLLVWRRDSAVAPAEEPQMVKEMPVTIGAGARLLRTTRTARTERGGMQSTTPRTWR
jgi:hypothetical protein